MRIVDIIRNAIPNADDMLCEHILFSMTPYPIGRVTAQELYKASCRYIRAHNNNIELCLWCKNKATINGMCIRCNTALSQS